MGSEIYNPSRRDFLKGVVIGAGGYALGSSIMPQKEAMAQSVQSYLEKVPMEARWDIVSDSYVRLQVSYFKALYDQRGKEKLVEFQKERARILAPLQKRIADCFGFAGNDAKSAAEIVSTLTNIAFGSQTKYEFEEATAKKARVKCINCAFWNTAQSMKISEDLCSAHCRYYWEGFAGAINPRLTSTLVKSRPLGHSVCEWILELKA